MHLMDAMGLITHPEFQPEGKQRWADLGCGSGLFTMALATKLQAGSLLYAVDTKPVPAQLIESGGTITIHPLQMDFITDKLPLENLEGILMANSLHYVKDQPAFIRKILQQHPTLTSFLIIEYDIDKPVKTWVPYPIPFSNLVNLFAAAGWTRVIKLRERNSLYNRGRIYSSLICR